MTVLDTINRVFREYKRYTGDGLPDAPTGAALPVGDPSSGPHSPKKSEIRAALIEVFQGAEDTLADLDARYLGAMDNDPTTDNAGQPLITGAIYFNTAVGQWRVWSGAVWENPLAGIADGSISEPKHATGGVSTRALADEAVTLAKVGADAKADFRLVDPNGPRIPVTYHGPTSVQIVGVRSIAMGGFRHKGRYKVDRAPVLNMPAFTNFERHIIDLGDGSTSAGDLFAESYHVKSNWYANFAAANDGDLTATLGSMPFLRVGSIAGNVITLNQGGENQRSIAGKTYQFTTDALVGADALVITETLNSRANAFSGRLTTVTANTQTTVTLADVGVMDEYDFFLIAPPGYDHYCYLNTLYMDTAEVRNIADSGTVVQTRGSANSDVNITGLIAAGGVNCPCDGHVSPLATGVFLNEGNSLSTTETGTGYSTWGMDNSHDSVVVSWHKVASAAQSAQMLPGLVPFSFSPLVNFRAAGALNTANNVRSMQMRGWIEP